MIVKSIVLWIYKNCVIFLEQFAEKSYHNVPYRGRRYYLNLTFWGLILLHKKDIKNCFYLEMLGERPLIESGLYLRGYGIFFWMMKNVMYFSPL